MPIIKSAKKSMRQSVRRRVFNVKRAISMKKEVKVVKKLKDSGDKEEAQKHLSVAYKAIDKAAKRGIIKKNTASRKKSRLAKLLVK
ncbi:MAG: 30S ribosomal protein S20 [bacterium]|nr:30S ribosomal protein S20 [bacterium]